ncbi:MAG: polysaccharide pyruvyl transferase CsaB [Patescibacteria group bacterium]
MNPIPIASRRDEGPDKRTSRAGSAAKPRRRTRPKEKGIRGANDYTMAKGWRRYRRREVLPIIVISGYYGAGNTGDEAILAAMLEALRAAIPGGEFVVLSRDPAHTRTLHGVAALHRGLGRDLRAKLSLLRRADLFISGGGGLFQDAFPRRHIPRSVLYYAGICALARLCGCPVMFYAQGIGPLRGRLARRLARAAAGLACAVTVRDPGSAALLLDLGARGAPIRVAADPVLAWHPPREGGVLERFGLGGRRILAVSVRPWPGQACLRAVAGAADRAAAHGLRPVFVPFARGVDEEACRAARASMADGDAAVILPHLPPADVYRVLAGAELVLGMRLHALIFAAAAGVPMVGLAYEPKVRALMDLLGLAPWSLALDADAGGIWEALSSAGERRGEIGAALNASMPDLRRKALSAAAWAAEIAARGRPRREG